MRRYFYAYDVEEILKIKIPYNACQDYVAWNFEKSGLFSVKSAYRLAMRTEHGEGEIGTSSTPPDGRKVWKDLWYIKVPEKIKVFAWKVANNGIPTQANKCYRHLVQYETCELCGHVRGGLLPCTRALPTCCCSSPGHERALGPSG